MEAGGSLALIRFSSEMSTKARGTRRRFVRRLLVNIRDAMRSTGVVFDVDSQWTRIFVRSSGGPNSFEVLQRVPGLSSYSLVVARCAADLDEIVRTGVEHFAPLVKGRSFAVRARRTGTHPFSSNDLMYALGAALNPGARVDLSAPEVEVDLEVRDDEVYFFSGKREGLGGLPLAVEGRAVCLLSGGFDSGVAAWMMLKRGVSLDYVFCNLAGEAYERSVLQVAKILADRWSYGSRPRLHAVDFGPVLDDIRARTKPAYWQLVLKTLMYRAAEGVAAQVGGQVTVTGESIGQVSSQTLANLAAIDGSSTLPIFRPLIAFDKLDIISATRRIGTFDISSKVREYCAIAPGNPATGATLAELEAERAKLDPAVLLGALASRKIINLRSLTTTDLVVDYLFTQAIPRDAVVIDLRDEAEREKWRYPGSIHRPLWELTASPRSVDRDRTYVVYCDHGMQAAHVAEAMQREGIEAYAFRGGTAALRKSVDEGSPL